MDKDNSKVKSKNKSKSKFDGHIILPKSGCEESPLFDMTQNSLANNEWNSVFLNHDASIEETKNTIVRVGDGDRKIVDQEDSGTCWIHATTANYREIFLNNDSRINPEKVRFSIAFLLYHHLMESSASFLHKVFSHKDKSHIHPINMCIFGDILNEGASGNTGYRLVRRYGIVPFDEMPSTEQTYNPQGLVKFLTKVLKSAAVRIRQSNQSINKIGEITLRIIQRYLCSALGTPPLKFTYAFDMQKDGSFFVIPEISPLGFYKKYLKPFDSHSVFILINTRHSVGKWIAVKDSATTTDTSLEDTAELVVTEEHFEEILRQSIRKKYPVYVGIDVDSDLNVDQGWGHIGLYQPEIILSDDEKDFINVDKQTLLNLDLMGPNHAVLVIGYGTDNNKPDGIISHWLIENSWGEDSGDEGYIRVSREWLFNNCYGACVQKRFLPRGVSKTPTKDNMIIVECYEGKGKLL
jgi:bleomycin hydrolase